MPDYQKRCELLTRENDELRERVAQLEELLGMSFDAPAFLCLAESEAKLFGMLLAREAVTKDGAMHALYTLRTDADAVVDDKIIDVFVCKLRKKLEPFDLAIETNWGQGYFMTPAMKDRARALMKEQGQAA